MSSLSRPHLPALDGLRGLAILLVIGFHYFRVPEHLPQGTLSQMGVSASKFGMFGVDLFFVLSGFLITRILLSTWNTKHYLRNFVLRRSLRILPLYYAFLLYYFFVSPHFLSERQFHWESSWWWLFNLQNFPISFTWKFQGPVHYWTLAIEEQFYLIWPLLVCWVPRKGLAWLCGTLVLLALGLRWSCESETFHTYYFTLTRIDALAMGALLALCEPLILRHTSKTRKGGVFAAIAAAIALAAVYSLLSETWHAWQYALKFTFVGIIFASLLATVLASDASSFLSRCFQFRPLTYLGTLSFGVYVLHEECMRYTDAYLGASHPLNGLVFVLSTWVISALSFRYLEQPFLKLKRYF